MPVQYYSWEDEGAPQFEITYNVWNDYRNNITEIMDAILVTGYGTKPGFGWTKEMVSEVPDSNRTVYKNKSAHADDMFFIIENTTSTAVGFRFQIADEVTSPENYSGYSQVAASYQGHTGVQHWHAIGDELTIIFIFFSWYVNQSSSSNYAPTAFYAGDFEIPNGSNPKGWGLIAANMAAGTLDTVDSSFNGYHYGVFNLRNSYDATFKEGRPVTQVPGQEWNEDVVYSYCQTFSGYEPNLTGSVGPYREIADFESNVQLRSEWYFVLERTNFYRLRGVYNILPFLAQKNNSNIRNWGQIINAFDESYLPLPRRPTNSVFEPLTVFIKTTGEW